MRNDHGMLFLTGKRKRKKKKWEKEKFERFFEMGILTRTNAHKIIFSSKEFGRKATKNGFSFPTNTPF